MISRNPFSGNLLNLPWLCTKASQSADIFPEPRWTWPGAYTSAHRAEDSISFTLLGNKLRWFFQIFLKRAAKPSAGNTSAGFPWLKWPQILLNLTWLCTEASQTFSGTFGTFFGTSLNLTWRLHQCTPELFWAEDPISSTLLGNKLRCYPQQPQCFIFFKSFWSVLRSQALETPQLGFRELNGRKSCWTWPGSAPKPPRPSPEPSPEPCWTWLGFAPRLRGTFSGNSGTFSGTLHQSLHPVERNLALHQNRPDLLRNLRNLLRTSSNLTRRLHQCTPELFWAEDPISLRCWGKMLLVCLKIWYPYIHGWIILSLWKLPWCPVSCPFSGAIRQACNSHGNVTNN